MKLRLHAFAKAVSVVWSPTTQHNKISTNDTIHRLPIAKIALYLQCALCKLARVWPPFSWWVWVLVMVYPICVAAVIAQVEAQY